MKISDFLRFYGVYRRCGNSKMVAMRLALYRISDSYP